eukprot:gene1169-1806_t
MRCEVTDIEGVNKWTVHDEKGLAATIYLPKAYHNNEKHGKDREDDERRTVEEIYEVLGEVEGFGDFRIGGRDGERYSSRHFDPKGMFPHHKRLGHVFLSLLGRTADVMESVPCVPHVSLSRSLTERTDGDTVININAATVDQVTKQDVDSDLLHDSVWSAYAKEFSQPNTPAPLRIPNEHVKYGPPAAQMYGTKSFSITVKELQQLERSIRVATSPELPRKFYVRLVQLTTKSVQHQRFFDLRRSVPIELIGREDHFTGFTEKLLKLYTDRRIAALQDLKVKQAKRPGMLRRIAELSGPAGGPAADDELKRVLSDFQWLNYEIDDHAVVARNSAVKIGWLTDPKALAQDEKIAAAVQDLVNTVKKSPVTYGFTGGIEHSTLKKALTELCPDVCISQRGYFFVNGKPGQPNQIAPRSRQPIVFLASPGLDFCDPSTTDLEARKYFRAQLPSEDAQNGTKKWKGFLPDAWEDLLSRVTRLYKVIFRSCLWHGVQNPSMLAMGLGVFLANVAQEDRPKVAEAYFKAQWKLLCKDCWGIRHYFLNPVQFAGLACGSLEEVLKETGGDLRCAVVLHSRDVKFLAAELADRPNFHAPAMLNPSDCASIWLGLMGYFWETGREECFVGEEDFCSSGTGTLALSTITSVFGEPSRHLIDEKPV